MAFDSDASKKSSLVARLLRAGLWVSAGLLLGRAAGFFREVSIATVFGASDLADVTIAILTIPDLLVNVLVGGALSAALIPEFARLPSADQRRLFVQATLLALIAFTLLASLLAILAQPLIGVLAPGFAGAKAGLAAHILGIVLYMMPLTIVAGVSTALLQANKQFAVPAVGTLTVNAAIIVGIWAGASYAHPLVAIAVSLLIGGVARWLMQLLAIGGPTPIAGALTQRWVDRLLLRRYCQAMLAGGFLLLIPVAARALATLHGEGALAVFNYAQRLIELPLTVGLTVLSVVLFPHLSEAFGASRHDEGRELIFEGAIFTLTIGLAMVFPMVWFSEHIVTLAYGWGRLSPAALEQISTLTVIGFTALPASGLIPLLMAGFNAKRDMRAPMQVSLATLALFLPTALLAQHTLGLPGLMLAFVASHWGAAIALMTMLSKRHGIHLPARFLRRDVLGSWLVGAILLVPVASLGSSAEPGWPWLLWMTGGFVMALCGVVLARPRYRHSLMRYLSPHK